MRILLLGANGMLGSSLKILLNKAYPKSIVALGRSECDISSLEECKEIIEHRVKPDFVINAAAFTNVDACEVSTKEAFSANAEGPKNLAICCKKVGSRLIHFSTDYVFDGRKQVPYTETDKPNPINAYGESKLAGEYFIRSIFNNFLIIRVAGLFGKNGNNFVNKIIIKSKESDTLNVVDDQTVSFTYTTDVAKVVIRLLDKKTPPILNITNKEACNWYEFAREIIELSTGDNSVQVNPIKVSSLSLQAVRPLYSVLSRSLFEQVSGYRMRHWKVALADFLKDTL